jgi:hypothetical protein
MNLFLLSFILLGVMATTAARKPIHHRADPQHHDVDGGRVFERSVHKRQEARETGKTRRTARRHRRNVVVVPPTTCKATKKPARVNGQRKRIPKF